MAIIYSYPKNTDILSTDIIVGSSAKIINGKRKNATKNFAVGAIAQFYNEYSSIAITGQNNFFFQNNIAPSRKNGSISFVSGGGAGTAFDSITVLRVSKYATSGSSVADYIATLVNQAIIIGQVDNLNNFGIYKFNSITAVPGSPDFVDIGIEVVNANGSIQEDKFYGLAVYPGFVNPDIDPVGNYTFEQPLVKNNGVVTINQSSNTADGYLSSVDWNIFNNKQSLITLTTTGSSGTATFAADVLNIPDYSVAIGNLSLDSLTDVDTAETKTTPVATDNLLIQDSEDSDIWKKLPWTSVINNTLQVTPVTILAASWTLVSGLYEYDYSNANISSSSIVNIIPENSAITTVQAAQILPKTVSSAGSVKLYSTNLPSGNFDVTVNIMRN